MTGAKLIPVATRNGPIKSYTYTKSGKRIFSTFAPKW